MTLPREEIKARLADRYTAAELADAIDLDANLFLDYFLEEVLLMGIEALEIEEVDNNYE
jgi:hypothetical protein